MYVALVAAAFGPIVGARAQGWTAGPAAVAAEPTPKLSPEAWWTGPIFASSANTLPRGHFLVEPYLFDARSRGSDYLGSLTYILYGFRDDLTIGAIPTFGGARITSSRRSRRVDVNDLTLSAQYRLRRATDGDVWPTISLIVQHTLPLGRFDRLGGDPALGIGTGGHATLVGIYAQRVDRFAGGRPLRTRINVTRSFAWRGRVRDDSVFGTPVGFRGTARAGGVATFDVSLEYSLNRNWVLAVEGVSRWTGRGRVDERSGSSASAASIPSSARFSLAPAVEYSWSSTRGVLLGARYTPDGRNVSASITPVVAFNAVF